MDRLRAAIDLAFDAHAGQVDKAADPYIWHILRVGMSLLPDMEAAIVGLLHDAIEDSPLPTVTARMINSDLGLRIETCVIALTRLHGQTYAEYIHSIATHPDPIVRQVKIADLYDNLRIDRLLRAAANGADIAALVTKYTHALRRLLADQFPSAPRFMVVGGGDYCFAHNWSVIGENKLCPCCDFLRLKSQLR